MNKYAHFLIDDVIWVLRDLTRDRPASMFDHPFLSALKRAHEAYGLRVQWNLFFRTSAFYGDEDFTLSDMTDAYRAEFSAASDWLKMGFHAKEEFPDYPYVNAPYTEVAAVFSRVKREVLRFAGESSFTHGYCPHWNAVSREGVRALYDAGVRIMDVSVGDPHPYNGNPDTLPYGHAARLLHNRCPETLLYSRGGPNTAINNSLAGYNHFTNAQLDATLYKTYGIKDEETGMVFKKFHLPEMTVNLMQYDEIEEVFSRHLGNEYIGVCTHEQYAFPHYFAYQPDWEKKLDRMARILHENGYTFLFASDLLAL